MTGSQLTVNSSIIQHNLLVQVSTGVTLDVQPNGKMPIFVLIVLLQNASILQLYSFAKN